MSRPQTLHAVSVIARDEPSYFALALREFLDEFYLDHPDGDAQARRIAEAAEISGEAFTDAWLGASGEHLARRWRLPVPGWTLRPEHSRLTRPRFVPDARPLRGMLIVMSPPAFRSRLLYGRRAPDARPLPPGRPSDRDAAQMASRAGRKIFAFLLLKQAWPRLARILPRPEGSAVRAPAVSGAQVHVAHRRIWR
jgi:hypothetical protein